MNFHLDADTVSTIFVVLFLLGMAATALYANQRGPAEELHQPVNRWWE